MYGWFHPLHPFFLAFLKSFFWLSYWINSFNFIKLWPLFKKIVKTTNNKKLFKNRNELNGPNMYFWLKLYLFLRFLGQVFFIEKMNYLYWTLQWRSQLCNGNNDNNFNESPRCQFLKYFCIRIWRNFHINIDKSVYGIISRIRPLNGDLKILDENWLFSRA